MPHKMVENPIAAINLPYCFRNKNFTRRVFATQRLNINQAIKMTSPKPVVARNFSVMFNPKLVTV